MAYEAGAAAALPCVRTRDSQGPVSVAAPDHRAIFVSTAIENGWKRGVEVGVGTGNLLHRLLGAGIEMVGVDLGRRLERRRAVERICAEYGQQCRMLWMASHWAADHVEDGWADFVFIDAGHSYGAVKSDIAAWKPKVRKGGWLGGHDYHPAHPGVMKAVDEVFRRRVLLEGWIWSAG